MRGIGLGEQQTDRSSVVGHEHVDVAVVVDVAEGGAAPDRQLLQGGAGLTGHVLKRK
jgi:hypothetical protein